MKTGIVDVGGGLRGVYATGIFDYCLSTGIAFDVCIGVSAGSANVASYMAGQLRRRAEHYNQGIRLAKEYEAQGKVLIVAPDDTCGVDTLTKDREALRKFYEKGYHDACAIPHFLL